MVPFAFSEGVKKGRISLSRFVELVSTNAAKIFGLFPQKGTITVGSDADVMILDPNKEVMISGEILHQNVDYTPYEGCRVTGWPVVTISRGRVVYDHGQIRASPGKGLFVKRGRFRGMLDG
jgi:dihydropyrimidinase